jgi:putative N6-adenine-specific DNA methylase
MLQKKPTIILKKESQQENPEPTPTNSSNFQLVAKTLVGLEDVLAGEIEKAGGANIKVLNRAVSFEGDLECIYRTNYTCRTALRVLKVIGLYRAGNEHELYQRILSVDWSQYINSEQTLAVDAYVSNSRITNSHYASLKVKDAIVDQFRRTSGSRPSIDLENPDLRVNIHLTGDQCTISIDSSGESLHKRGYRQWQGEAPISEVLAAGMIMLTGWTGETRFHDPMCGSGTLLIEAVMIARNIPPGFYRPSFGFMKWRDFDRQLWEKIKSEYNREIKTESPPITGADSNQRTLSIAERNLTEARLEKFVTLNKLALEDSIPEETGGIVVTNPPYGERMEQDDLNGFYKMVGDMLKKNYTGWDAWLITSDYEALKSVGLRTSHKIKLYNGPLECRFVKYEMYTGSRKKGSEEG